MRDAGRPPGTLGGCRRSSAPPRCCATPVHSIESRRFSVSWDFRSRCSLSIKTQFRPSACPLTFVAPASLRATVRCAGSPSSSTRTASCVRRWAASPMPLPELHRSSSGWSSRFARHRQIWRFSAGAPPAYVSALYHWFVDVIGSSRAMLKRSARSPMWRGRANPIFLRMRAG